MTGTVEILLIAAAIIYVLARRLMGESALGKRLLLIPAVLGVVGVTQLSAHSTIAVVFLVISTVISVAFGLVRGMGKSDQANEAVLRARALAVSGLKETRRAVHALRQDTLPLPESISRLAQSRGASFRVTDKAERVSVEISQAVIRAAQEALTNAHKHAPGADVDLLLEYTAST